MYSFELKWWHNTYRQIILQKSPTYLLYPLRRTTTTRQSYCDASMYSRIPAFYCPQVAMTQMPEGEASCALNYSKKKCDGECQILYFLFGLFYSKHTIFLSSWYFIKTMFHNSFVSIIPFVTIDGHPGSSRRGDQRDGSLPLWRQACQRRPLCWWASKHTHLKQRKLQSQTQSILWHWLKFQVVLISKATLGSGLPICMYSQYARNVHWSL